MALGPGPAGLKFWKAPGLSADNTADINDLPAGVADCFYPWGRKRPVQDWVRGASPQFMPAAILFAADANSYALTGSSAGLTVSTAETTNLPAGAANWFNPWGRKRPVQDWFRGSIPATVNYLPAGMTGGYVPWGRPPRQDWVWSVAYVSASGVTDTRLSAGAGNYALSGSTAGLTATSVQYIFRPPLITRLWSRSRQVSISAQNWVTRSQRLGDVRLPALAGSYAVSGTNAQFVQVGTIRLTAAAGSYTINGSSAALALRLTANSGSYTVSGSAAVFPRGFAAGAGAYAITGTAAQLAQAGAITLAYGAGAYAITGTAASLALRFTANSGAYTVSGSAAVLARRFAAGAGAYAIIGTSAALTASGLLLPTPVKRCFKIATANRTAMVAAGTTRRYACRQTTNVAGKAPKDQRTTLVN